MASFLELKLSCTSETWTYDFHLYIQLILDVHIFSNSSEAVRVSSSSTSAFCVPQRVTRTPVHHWLRYQVGFDHPSRCKVILIGQGPLKALVSVFRSVKVHKLKVWLFSTRWSVRDFEITYRCCMYVLCPSTCHRCLQLCVSMRSRMELLYLFWSWVIISFMPFKFNFESLDSSSWHWWQISFLVWYTYSLERYWLFSASIHTCKPV